MGEEFVTSLREVLGEVENERVSKIQLASARLQDYIVSLEDLRPLRDPSRPPRPEPFTIEVSALEAMVSSTKK